MPYRDPEKQKLSQHQSYLRNKRKVRDRSRKRYLENKQWYFDLKRSYGCKVCGEKEPYCLDFHHIDPKKKELEVTNIWRQLQSKEVLLKEIDKCICVCSNCHRKIHAGIIKLRAG